MSENTANIPAPGVHFASPGAKMGSFSRFEPYWAASDSEDESLLIDLQASSGPLSDDGEQTDEDGFKPLLCDGGDGEEPAQVVFYPEGDHGTPLAEPAGVTFHEGPCDLSMACAAFILEHNVIIRFQAQPV